MPKTCFVIMPFSKTASCTKREWTEVFENVLKPAIEDAGLDYECRRSTATRGNIVKAILQYLNEAYIVLADLTDRNANVFYELGVRHSLKDRSILIAQKKEDIPFDLQTYAYHVYDWKTDEGRKELAEKIGQLLKEVEGNPDRPDNPVSDFLRNTTETNYEKNAVEVAQEEEADAQPLLGPSAEGLDAAALARKLSRSEDLPSARKVLRLTRVQLPLVVDKVAEELNKIEAPPRVSPNDTPTLAQKYITVVEPISCNMEQFVLASVEEGWEGGVSLVGLKLAGDLISIHQSNRIQGNRLARGVFPLLALRLLVLSGAKALAEENFDILSTILREPIEVEEANDRFSHYSLVQRGGLFYSEAFLRHAGQATQYLASLWRDQPHLRNFFNTEGDYQFYVANFLIALALATQLDPQERPFYPAFSRFPQSGRAMSAFCSRLASSDPYIDGIASAIGVSKKHLRETWSTRVRELNSTVVAEPQSFANRDATFFPDPMDRDVPELQ